MLVVGAGPAGLAAMAALSEAKVEFTGVESHANVGGIWDATNPISSVYAGLHMVTSRFTSHIGTAMPNDWPHYPERQQAFDYLHAFAQSKRLHERIEFETRFEEATKTAQGTWLATLRAGKDRATIQKEFRGIVFATGAYNRDHRRFPQELLEQANAAGISAIHSADYRAPEPYAGKRVLVVGIGNSGSDIAEKISVQARRTILSVRTTPWINPLTLLGVPCDKLAAEPAPLPDWLGLWLFRMGRRLSIGGYRRLGLKPPEFGLNDRTPMSDRGIVTALRSGRVVARSNVVSLEGGTARFADPLHSSEEIDAVVFATGFARSYPLLPRTGNIDASLLFYLLCRREPTLAYMTELVGSSSCWPIFVAQARAIAAWFRAIQDRSATLNGVVRRLAAPSPDFKGKLFRLADEFHIDYRLYAEFLRDFEEWIARG